MGDTGNPPKRRRTTGKQPEYSATFTLGIGEEAESGDDQQPPKYQRISQSDRRALVSRVTKAANRAATEEWMDQVKAQSTWDLARMPNNSVGDASLGSGRNEGWGSIHPTHDKALLKNIVFCRTCGARMARAGRLLKQPCMLEPTSKGALERRTRMLAGLHPVRTTREWPDGTSTTVPVALVTIN